MNEVHEIGFTWKLISGQNFMHQIAFHRFENAENWVPTKWTKSLRDGGSPWLTVSARNYTFSLLLYLLIEERSSNCWPLKYYFLRAFIVPRTATQFLSGARAFSGHFEFGFSCCPKGTSPPALDCEQFLLFPPVIVYRARKRRPRGEWDVR